MWLENIKEGCEHIDSTCLDWLDKIFWKFRIPLQAFVRPPISLNYIFFVQLFLSVPS